ncbi:uncharacterized protein N7500_009042 [Penicillium coprophilum]|uniref:uncharacterized protein n=1 Tax=Penicillium coprophilum TaxID=36646 RepID=UPI0023A66F6F|nr:uncharacterized protein N7500_009042 [Penicillium coprophilum]KAJ5153603.1 hypothetical protein N7500_009042 [Penicillium coprophilum]
MAFPVNDHEAWESEEDYGNNPIYTDGFLVLDSIRDWKVGSPPGDWKTHFDPSTGTTWRPKDVRLCDARVIYALLTLSTKYKSQHLAYDFDATGDVRTSRVPRAPSVVAVQNSVRFLLAWKGVYVFTDPPRLVAGLVAAPPHLKIDDNLNTDEAEYHPPRMERSAKVNNIWELGDRTFNVRLCSTR